MRILLIGGSGFLGFHLVNFLEKSGHKVTIFDKRVGHFKNKRKKIILGDVNNYKKLSSVIRNKDIVYNFAAISDIGESMINPIQTAKINILGNVSILDLCVKYRVKKFIFASTIYVNSNSGSFYRISKHACEQRESIYVDHWGIWRW